MLLPSISVDKTNEERCCNLNLQKTPHKTQSYTEFSIKNADTSDINVYHQNKLWLTNANVLLYFVYIIFDISSFLSLALTQILIQLFPCVLQSILGKCSCNFRCSFNFSSEV